MGRLLGATQSMIGSFGQKLDASRIKTRSAISELTRKLDQLDRAELQRTEYLDARVFERVGEVSAVVNALGQAHAQNAERFDALLHAMAQQLSAIREVSEIQSNRLLGRVSTLSTSLEGRENAAPGSHAARLYLDLLEAELTGALHGDESAAPWTKDKFDSGRREIGRDWPKTAVTMIGTARMRNLRHLCERVIADKVPGDFIETGVWRGGACIYMRAILAALAEANRRIFVADSFRGLPPPDDAAFPADRGDTHHEYQQLAVSRADVEANFRRYGLLDEQVVFLEGWFKDTLHNAPIESLAILRLDGDMYESTIQALDSLYNKVSPGGIVIVDDYILPACAQAVDEYRALHGITVPLQEVDGAAVWWRVPRT